jgi:hypothetical protein
MATGAAIALILGDHTCRAVQPSFHPERTRHVEAIG